MCKSRKESFIEGKISLYSKKRGWLNYKFISPSNKGVPDRIFMKSGTLFFMEFKKEGSKPSKLQQRIHVKIKEKGFHVYVVDSIKKGIDIIDSYKD